MKTPTSCTPSANESRNPSEPRQRQGDPAILPEVMLSFVRVLMQLEQYAEVVSTADEWIPVFDTYEHPEAAIRARSVRADALLYSDQDGALGGYEQAQRLALDAGLTALGADIQDSLGRAHIMRDQMDEGVKWMLTASETARSVEESEMAARAEIFAAYWLAQKDRNTEAIALALGADE